MKTIKNENWKSVIELINKKEKTENINIEFDNEKILWKDAMLLGENGFEIPDKYIDYDDDNIDCSDIPEITEEDIKTGKIKWIYKAEFPIDNEIQNWITQKNIKLNELLPYLLKNFYQTVKLTQKNVAL